MAKEVNSVEEALALLGSQVTFREESDKLAFEAFVAGAVPAEEADPSELNKSDLLALAEARGVDVSPNDTKAEILAALDAADEEGS